MNLPNPTRCCPTCGGLFPFPSHYGLASNVYCLEPEHWRAIGLNPTEVLEAFEESRQKYAQLPTAMDELREALEEPSVVTQPRAPAAVEDDAEIHARFVHMLKWLDEPPTDAA